jgi:hypothetical protein
MKLFKSIILGLAGLMTFTSCNDWLDINDNPNTPAQAVVPVNTLLPWIQFHLGYATGAHGYRSQFICQAFTATSRTHRDGCSAQWEATTSMCTTPYQQFFVGAGPNIVDMYDKAMAIEAWHYAGAALILKSYGFLLMADMYGEMPYFEANAASAKPKYDTCETIYVECLKNIDEALELFNKQQPNKADVPALSKGDTWNGGDVQKWIKMSYLLKARTINQLSKKTKYYDADLILDCLSKAQQSIEDDTYIQHQDVKETSSDFISTDPMKTNFNWDQTYNGNRHITMPTKWLENLLVNFDNKGIEDPRADKILAWRQFSIDGEKVWKRGVGVDMQSKVRMPNGLANFISRANGGWNPSIAERAEDSVYVGIYAGSAGVYNTPNIFYKNVDGWYPSSGNVYVRPNSPYLWATYAEACFIKAEVLMRKNDKAGAFAAYKAGIQANIDEINKMLLIWDGDPAYADCPSMGQMAPEKIDAFMSGAIGTASDITMEKIMTQKFIAMLYSTVNWNDMRRHDYQNYMGWEMPAEYFENAAALKKIPLGKQWNRIMQCSHEINYNADELSAMQPHYADDDIWTYEIWWDIAE